MVSRIFFIGFISMFLIACNSGNKISKNSSSSLDKEKTAHMVNMYIDIEGMTCEIGCARLIQSKLYKMKGVNFAKISFENKNGNITFDRNKISDKELKTSIEKIAGGDIYKVIAMKEVENFSTN